MNNNTEPQNSNTNVSNATTPTTNAVNQNPVAPATNAAAPEAPVVTPEVNVAPVQKTPVTTNPTIENTTVQTQTTTPAPVQEAPTTTNVAVENTTSQNTVTVNQPTENTTIQSPVTENTITDNSTDQTIENTETQTAQETKPKFKIPINLSDKTKKIIAIAFIVIILAISATRLISYFKSKNIKEQNNNENVISDESYVDDIFFDDSEKDVIKYYKMEIYKNPYDKLCLDTDQDCDYIVTKIDVVSSNAKIIAVLGNVNDGYVLYNDENAMKIYSMKLNKIKVLDRVDLDYKYYKFKYIIDENKKERLLGLFYNKSENNNDIDEDCKYYDLRADKFKYEDYCLDDISSDLKYVTASKVTSTSSSFTKRDIYLMEINKERVLLTIENASDCDTLKVDRDFIVHSYGCSKNKIVSYYTMDGKLICEFMFNNLVDQNNGLVYYSEGDVVIKVDKAGNRNAANKFDNFDIVQIKLNHAIGINNNKLYIINIDEQKKYELADWDENYNFYHSLTKYYDEEQAKAENKKEGYYLVYEQVTPEGKKSNPGVEIYFNPKTKEIEKSYLEKIEK